MYPFLWWPMCSSGSAWYFPLGLLRWKSAVVDDDGILPDPATWAVAEHC